MKKLIIKRQRLVNEKGKTCQRCGTTEEEIQSSVSSHQAALSSMGINVQFKKETLDMATFKESPAESNRIWVAGRSLEYWLGAKTGQSQCCGVCGDSECRTVVVDGQTYETIPAKLITKVGLLAAAEMIGRESS